MRQIRHPPLRLPRVAPVLLWVDSEVALFYRLRPPSDETTPFGHVCGTCPSSTTQGPFPHRTGIIGPPSLRIRVHVGQQGHLRRYLFEQIVVDRRPGDVPAQGDKSDGERDVPVSRVGIERGSGDVEGIRSHGTQGFCGPRPLSNLYSSADEEVDSTALSHTVRRPRLWPHPVAVQRATVLSPQCTVRALTALIQLAPRDSLPLVFYIVTRLICVTPHPNRHRGSLRQDRVRFLIAGVHEAIRTRSRSTNQKQDVRLRLPGGVVILYIYTSHLSVASRAGFLLDERSPISYTAPSPSWPVAHARYLMDKNCYVYPSSTSCLLLGLVTGEFLGGIPFHFDPVLVAHVLFHFSLFTLSFFLFFFCFICILNLAY